MTIYIVCCRMAYSEDLRWQNVGVYLTKKKAKEHVAKLDKRYVVDIEEWEIEP